MSAGYSKCRAGLQDAAKGIETITTGIEQAGTRAIFNGQAVGQTMIETGKNLRSLATKYVCVQPGETVVREGLNTGISSLSSFSFEQLKQQICKLIQAKCRHHLSMQSS